jgi:hypothetical protein
VLRSGICLTTRLELGIVDGKRQTTNVVESFNNQLQDTIQTNRKCLLFFIVQKIIEYFDDITVEMAMGYIRMGDFRLVEEPKPHYEDLEGYLTQAHIVKRDVLMRAKRGVLSKVPSFLYSIEVLANTSTAEASIYRAKLENIFNNGCVQIVSHPVKPCALINDSDTDETPNWYTIHSSNNEWSWMWCSSRYKVCVNFS